MQIVRSSSRVGSILFSGQITGQDVQRQTSCLFFNVHTHTHTHKKNVLVKKIFTQKKVYFFMYTKFYDISTKIFKAIVFLINFKTQKIKI